jgi:hypothetical protein
MIVAAAVISRPVVARPSTIAHTAEAMGVQQGPGQLRARDAGAIGHAAVAREHGSKAPLHEHAGDEGEQQQQPEQVEQTLGMLHEPGVPVVGRQSHLSRTAAVALTPGAVGERGARGPTTPARRAATMHRPIPGATMAESRRVIYTAQAQVAAAAA